MGKKHTRAPCVSHRRAACHAPPPARPVLFKEGTTIDSVFKVAEGQVGLYRGDVLVAKTEMGLVEAIGALQEAPQPLTVKRTGY